MEIWKDIIYISRRGNEVHYKVSNKGRVFIKEQWIERPNGNGGYLKKEKELSYHYNEDGYIKCVIGSVHRIVAQAFIPNPLNKPTVNHINAIKDDNSLQNLEWATRKEQVEHYVSLGISCNPIIVNGIKFESRRKASEYIGCSENAIRLALKENRKCKGFSITYI